MKLLLEGARIVQDGCIKEQSILIEDGVIVSVFDAPVDIPDARVLQFNRHVIFPGFVDVHVHLREPGFSHKETIRTGTMAAAHGGYTTVCPMPNLKPVPDTLEHLRAELDIIERDAVIHTIPYAAITVGEKGEEPAALEEMAPYVAGFSDDGRGVQGAAMMKQAMQRAKALGKLIVAHCEDEGLLNGGYIHDGVYAAEHGHQGNPSASEWVAVARDLELVRQTGCSYHVCHVSTKETVALVRKARQDGLDVTCETGPHYLVFDDTKLQEDGRFKMNPPIRAIEDQKALIAGILDGTVGMIATDHAPHSAEEKAKGLKGSLNGIVGLETAFPVLYTHLVRPGVLTLEQLVDLMHTGPRKRFGLGTPIAPGMPADFTVYDLDEKYAVRTEDFLSMGKSSPFIGMELYGVCKLTVCGGKAAWKAEGVEWP